MISEKRRLNTFNIWPGFVDVLATLLIVTIFAIMISIVTQLYFNDLIGKKIKTLVSSFQTAGSKNVNWNATNNQGQPVSAGIYLYTVEAGKFRQTKKMILLK